MLLTFPNPRTIINPLHGWSLGQEQPLYVLDSLPYGDDMADTLPTDISPGDWIHSAPMQQLLAKGDAAPPLDDGPSSKTLLRTSKPVAATEGAKDMGSLGKSVSKRSWFKTLIPKSSFPVQGPQHDTQVKSNQIKSMLSA